MNKTKIKTHEQHRHLARSKAKDRKGTVNFFNAQKGYGSIKDSMSRHNYIVYVNGLDHPITASDYVSFEIEKTSEGLTATTVKRILQP